MPTHRLPTPHSWVSQLELRTWLCQGLWSLLMGTRQYPRKLHTGDSQYSLVLPSSAFQKAHSYGPHQWGRRDCVEYPDVWGRMATGVKPKHIEVTLNWHFPMAKMFSCSQNDLFFLVTFLGTLSGTPPRYHLELIGVTMQLFLVLGYYFLALLPEHILLSYVSGSVTSVSCHKEVQCSHISIHKTDIWNQTSRKSFLGLRKISALSLLIDKLAGYATVHLKPTRPHSQDRTDDRLHSCQSKLLLNR